MKLKEAKKKYNFLKKLDLTDTVFLAVANRLESTKKGDKEVYRTPLCVKCDPLIFLLEWDQVFKANAHKMNATLLDLEHSSRDKFGARSIAKPWAERADDLNKSFKQDDNHIPKCYKLRGSGTLGPLSIHEAADKMKRSTSACLPFLIKKGKALSDLMSDFYKYLSRKDPCVLFTRTQENEKTRNVWGYPFADSLNEQMFYVPLLWLQKQKYYRGALISPEVVAERITEMIMTARSTGRWLYSVDFKAFDSSVRYQYIIEAFEYIKSCFYPGYGSLLDYICKRFYTIGIITPVAVFVGNHGIPSGSTFTNEVDSLVQLMIALTCAFISENECQIQGDDGVYMMLWEDVPEFEASFKYAGLVMNDKDAKDKAFLSQDFVVYCQNLYHIDYMDDNGQIGGIYPIYRAINRLLFQERFVNFTKAGIKGRDYFGIRALSILENCKYHPLFEELVRFVLSREKFSLEVSDDGLSRYCNTLIEDYTTNNLKHQYGNDVFGIRKFAAYKMVVKILAEEADEELIVREVI